MFFFALSTHIVQKTHLAQIPPTCYVFFMVRKNIHMPNDVARAIGDLRHDARFKSETEAVVRLVEGASDHIKKKTGFVYLVRGSISGELKIGFSTNPNERMGTLKSEMKQDIEPLGFLLGDLLLETTAHVIWGAYRLHGEWFEDIVEIRDWFANHELSVDMPEKNKSKKRSVIIWTDEQHEKLERAATALGQSIPQFTKTAALEKAQAILDEADFNRFLGFGRNLLKEFPKSPKTPKSHLNQSEDE